MQYKPKTRPCSLCGLASTIDVDRNTEMGSVCVWYNTRITPDELDDPSAPLRTRCKQDGNHFVWKQQDVRPLDVLNARVLLADWYQNRMMSKTGITVAVISLILSLLAFFKG